jgi:hypothetical protein
MSESFQDLAAEADEGEEFRLVEAEDLIGQDFIIVSLRFFPGRRTDYVNVRVVRPDGEKVCFNDSGSGVRRQLLGSLEQRGVLSCPPGITFADTILDMEITHPWSMTADPGSDLLMHVDLRPPMRCRRGLRKSVYKRHGGDAYTFWIA